MIDSMSNIPSNNDYSSQLVDLICNMDLAKKKRLREICMYPYKNKKGNVYIMSAIDNRTIYKIGHANDVNARHRALKKEQNVKDIIFSIETLESEKTERILHLIFKVFNVKRSITKNHTEWFNVPHQIINLALNYICQLTDKYNGNDLYKKILSL